MQTNMMNQTTDLSRHFFFRRTAPKFATEKPLQERVPRPGESEGLG